jgi:ankyrin repeat protein
MSIGSSSVKSYGTEKQYPKSYNLKITVLERLIDYSKSGDVEGLGQLLDEIDYGKFDINELDEKTGSNPLQTSAKYGQLEVMALLLKRSPDINAFDKYKQTSLMLAASKGHPDVLNLLIEKQADILYKDDDGNQAIHKCARYGNITIMESLLNHSSTDIEAMNNIKETPLSTALRFEMYEICKLLLSKGANINCIGINGNTPLMKAAFDGNIKTLKFILSNSGDVTMVNHNNENALLIACKRNLNDAAAILMEYNADINCVDSFGRSALMHACLISKPSLVRFLLEKGADTNIKDKRLFTALMYACQSKYSQSIEIVQCVIVTDGIDVNAVDRDYNNALAFACMNQNLSVANILLRAGADPSSRNADNMLPADHFIDSELKRQFEITQIEVIDEGIGVRPPMMSFAKPDWLMKLNTATQTGRTD